MNPIDAVTSDDPYPFYAGLREQGPLIRDPHTGLVLATTAQAVEAILASDARTRPADAPVPPAIIGTPAAEIFGRLVRMTDGETQRVAKAAIVAAMATATPGHFGRRAHAFAKRHWQQSDIDRRSPRDIAFCVPVQVVADALGFDRDEVVSVQRRVAAFTGCISPLSGPDEIASAVEASRDLRQLAGGLIEREDGQLAQCLRNEMAKDGIRDADIVLANTIGLMSQTYDATAALILTTFTTMARRHQAAVAGREDMMSFIREVARYDSPIQNTRRFFHTAASVLDFPFQAGDGVLLLLASANRDGAVNAQPDVFDPGRLAPKLYTFSQGTHACPGEDFAIEMAAGVVEGLLEEGYEPHTIALDELGYLPSANARIPLP